MYQQQIDKQYLYIEGSKYTALDWEGGNTPDFASRSPFHYQLYLFLCDWFSPATMLGVHTSGSTGSPQPMEVEKSRMINSALLTCQHLDLHQADTTLLCMSLDYIAGKMMVVRSLVAGLDIYPISPTSNPLQASNIANNINFQFAAMVPMQVYGCLATEAERAKLAKIHTLIIGGGAIDREIENTLRDFPNAIYATYGMTETLSHIALRRINGTSASDSYTPLHAVGISTAPNHTLIIDAPLVANNILYTNDIAEINEDGSFKILGRIDNIINSGGIKIQLEEIEQTIRPCIQGMFAISSLPDSKFGEIVVLVVEKNTEVAKDKLESIVLAIHRPKKIIVIAEIPLTDTGKIAREEVKKIIRKQK